MNPITAKPPPIDRGSLVLEMLRQIRDEYRANGDTVPARIIDRAMVRVARQLAKRTDQGRRDDEPTPSTPPLASG